jgi:oligoendopeptidase F
MSSEVLPRWDVGDLYPSLTSREFQAAMERIGADVDRLAALYDRYNVARGNTNTTGADEVIDATNDVHDRIDTLSVVILATTATDSTDADGQRAASELDLIEARLTQLNARLTAWVGSAGADAMSQSGTVALDHRYSLNRLETRSTHQMEPGQEHLFAELNVTGAGAWSQLYNDLTSQLMVTVGDERLPMPAVRARATHRDQAVRQQAYEAELQAWPKQSTALAAALNAIKGQANVVNGRRQWSSALDASLYANAITPATFHAMQAAVTSALGDMTGWMRTKARHHGAGANGGLKWFDLFAPLAAQGPTIDWNTAVETVQTTFQQFSPQLGSLVERSLKQRWIDAESRPGKRGGAFCAPLIEDRSLVLLNWSGSLEGVSTMAHELGHAYHNVQLAHRTPMQRALTMSLAETASIFCETLLVEHLLLGASDEQRLAVLDVDLQGSTQIICDIRSRFLFESQVFARRSTRTLAAAELCALMSNAQQEAYGDGLCAETRHQWMWAAKPHYYNSHFYNWPYTFGQLFGLGLHAAYQADPERFVVGYDALLSEVAMASAESLALRFGLDLTSEAFWQSSIDQIRTRISDYDALTNASLPVVSPR